jgi:hypothetical protein
MIVSLGTWSVAFSFFFYPFGPLCLCASFAVADPILKGDPLTQDDMSAEYTGRAEAGADCRRTTSQASARKAQGLRVIAVTNPIHGGIFATQNTHIYVYRDLLPYPKETSLPITRFTGE